MANLKAWSKQNKNYEFSCRVLNENLSFCVQKQCLDICQCSEFCQNHLQIRQSTEKSNSQKNAKKKPNFIWPFFKNKQSQRSWKRAKNCKFGLKKAKLATLAPAPHPHQVQPARKAVRVPAPQMRVPATRPSQDSISHLRNNYAFIVGYCC